jgi:hypothetical protein
MVSISDVSRGKHAGHAVEAHCRGLLSQIVAKQGGKVARSVELGLPVETDAVVIAPSGLVRAIIIVAYNSDSGDTEKRIDHSSHKFYRTRLEFNEAIRLFAEDRSLFDEKFTVLTVIYGTRQGWKKKLLAELAAQCPPLIFVPDILGDSECAGVVRDAFDLYEKSSKAKRSESVEEFFAESKLADGHAELLDVLTKSLKEGWRQTLRAVQKLPPAGGGARVVDGFRSRIRQGLSLLSLFSNSEIEAWLTKKPKDLAKSSESLSNFVRRGVLLDVVNLTTAKSILGKSTAASLRRPLDGTEYAPHRPDFSDWSQLKSEYILQVLDSHRALPMSSSSFSAGGLDQAAANLNGWSDVAANLLPQLASAIERGKASDVRKLLSDPSGVVSPEKWHPCKAEEFGFLLPWSLAVAAVATSRASRAEFRRFQFRRNTVGVDDAKSLAESLLADRYATAKSIEEVAEFVRRLMTSSVETLADIQRPLLMTLEVSTSWIAAIYLAVTTNPSHNPLSVIARRWCEKRGLTDLQGYPEKRGAAVSMLTGDKNSRLEWTVAGRRGDGTLVIVEPRSITANHIGDKAKEVFDRLAQTRAVARSAGIKTHFVGILDGDFDASVLEKFGSRIGYDEILSVATAIDDTFGSGL